MAALFLFFQDENCRLYQHQNTTFQKINSNIYYTISYLLPCMLETILQSTNRDDLGKFVTDQPFKDADTTRRSILVNTYMPYFLERLPGRRMVFRLLRNADGWVVQQCLKVGVRGEALIRGNTVDLNSSKITK